MDEDYILQKKIINVINYYMYNNILDSNPFYVSLEQFNEELKKFGNKYIISKINYILNKEKVKRFIYVSQKKKMIILLLLVVKSLIKMVYINLILLIMKKIDFSFL